MKTVITLLSLLVFPAVLMAGEIEITNLDPKPNEAILKSQELFRKEVEKATQTLKIEGVQIEVVVRKTNDDQDFVACTYKLPNIGNSLPRFAVHIKPSLLKTGDTLVFEHIALHELTHIKNHAYEQRMTSLNLSDENEVERNTEYEVYKIVGEEKYKEFLKHHFQQEPKLHETFSEAGYIKMMMQNIGVAKEK